MTLSGPSGTVVQSAPGTPTNGAPKGPTQSGAYTNLLSYLDVNKEQATGLGQNVGQKVSQTGVDARNQLQNADTSFKSQADAGSLANRETAIDEAKNIVNTGYNQKFGESLAADQLDRFKTVGTAAYKGPDSYTNAKSYDSDGVETGDLYSATKAKIDKANDYSKATETDEGRLTLLQEMYAKPTYSRGQQSFDNLLLGSSEQGKQALADARASNMGLDEAFDSNLSAAQVLSAARKAEHSGIAKEATDYLNTQQASKATGVDARLQNVSENWANEYNDYAALLKNSDGGKNLALTQAQQEKLGLQDNDRLYNLLKGITKDSDNSALNKYLTLNTFDRNTAISKDEQAQLTALDILRGQVGQSAINKYTDASKAGTVGSSLDASRFGKEQDASQRLFEQYAKDTQMSDKQSRQSDIMKEITYDAWGQTGWEDKVISDNPITGRQVVRVPTYGYITNRNSMDVGDAMGSAEAKQYVADYLEGRGPAVTFGGQKSGDLNWINPVAFAEGLFGASSDEHIGRLQKEAQGSASQNVYSQILAALEEQGYNNQIKKK